MFEVCRTLPSQEPLPISRPLIKNDKLLKTAHLEADSLKVNQPPVNK